MNNDLIKNTTPELTLSREVKELILESRSQVTVAVNVTLTMLYWQIGKRINEEVLRGERAEYGKQIVSTLSGQLSMEFGKGFAEKNLRRMMQFATVFEDHGIVATLLRQLSWSHFTLLLPLKDELQRNFYAEMCRLEKWSVRTLRKRIDSMLFERTALSKKPEELISAEIQKLQNDNRVTPNMVLKDPYILDFLELNDHYFEKDLEDAILREMELFLLELGSGFAFMARQKRIQIDNDDYYIDLLFYHRDLNRLIVIDLKLGDFKAQYKGQMELYLRWLSKHERRAGEAAPLGIILCAGKNQELVELLELSQSGIHVAEYLTVLPEKELLQKKLHDAMTNARLRLENRGEAL